MTLLERRRMLMSRKAEPEWDYVLPAMTPSKQVYPIQLEILAGQTLVFEWEGLASNSWSHYIWTLKDGAKFVGRSGANEPTRYLAASGRLRYIVETGGTLVLGGNIKYPDTLWGTYAFRADVLKLRIT